MATSKAANPGAFGSRTETAELPEYPAGWLPVAVAVPLVNDGEYVGCDGETVLGVMRVK